MVLSPSASPCSPHVFLSLHLVPSFATRDEHNAPLHLCSPHRRRVLDFFDAFPCTVGATHHFFGPGSPLHRRACIEEMKWCGVHRRNEMVGRSVRRCIVERGCIFEVKRCGEHRRCISKMHWDHLLLSSIVCIVHCSETCGVLQCIFSALHQVKRTEHFFSKSKMYNHRCISKNSTAAPKGTPLGRSAIHLRSKKAACGEEAQSVLHTAEGYWTSSMHSRFVRLANRRVAGMGPPQVHWSHPSSVPDGTSAPAVVPSLLRTTNKARRSKAYRGWDLRRWLCTAGASRRFDQMNSEAYAGASASLFEWWCFARRTLASHFSSKAKRLNWCEPAWDCMTGLTSGPLR